MPRAKEIQLFKEGKTVIDWDPSFKPIKEWDDETNKNLVSYRNKPWYKEALQNLTLFPPYMAVVSTLGTAGGGMNQGILIVREKVPDYDYLVEKQFDRKHAQSWMMDEIRHALRATGSPHVVNVRLWIQHEAPDNPGSIFFEYCDLGTVADLIDRHKALGPKIWIHELDIWRTFIHLSRGLEFIHKHQRGRVIHRDIKPPNILMKTGPNGEVTIKLGDFGCAQVLKQAGICGVGRAGTPGFIPPESPCFDTQSDIWALGRTIYCMCTLENNPANFPAQEPATVYTGSLLGTIAWCTSSSWQARPQDGAHLHAHLREVARRYNEKALRQQQAQQQALALQQYEALRPNELGQKYQMPHQAGNLDGWTEQHRQQIAKWEANNYEIEKARGQQVDQWDKWQGGARNQWSFVYPPPQDFR